MIPKRLSAGSRSPTSSGFERARRSFSRRRRRRAAAFIPERPASRRSTSSRARRGSPRNGRTSAASARSFRRRPRSRFSPALGLEVASQAQARDSLTRLIDDTQRRRLPFSLVLRLDQPLVAPLRDAPRPTDARIEREDGAAAEWLIEAADGARRDLPDGRSVSERPIALPTLPIGRHRLIVDGVECALTIAPPETYSPKAALRKRFGVAAQLYALRRADEDGRDQGIGDFSALARRGRESRRRRRGLSRRQPAAYVVPARPGAGEPILPLGSPLPRSDLHRRARRRRPAARRGAERRAGGVGAASSPLLRRPNMSSTRRCGSPSTRRSKPEARRSPACARRGQAIR